MPLKTTIVLPSQGNRLPLYVGYSVCRMHAYYMRSISYYVLKNLVDPIAY